MSSARPSWRPLIAGTVGLFLVILAFLAGQLRAGGDPAVGTRSTPVTQQTAPRTAPPDGFGTVPDDGTLDNMTPSGGALTTHQS
jgi:hypothetical protein